MTLLTAALRLSALSSDHSEFCWKLFNGSLSLVKVDRSFTCSCLVSAIRFVVSQCQGLQSHLTFCVKGQQQITLKGVRKGVGVNPPP